MFATIVVIIGAVCAGISSTISKKLSSMYQDRLLALVYQYISVVVFAVLLNMGFSLVNDQAFLPVLSGSQYVRIMVTSVIGYVGIYFLFQAFHRISAGIALIVANMATFIMYFVNIYLIDGNEAIGGIKLFLALMFFIIVSLLLVAEDQIGHKRIVINGGILFALGTALCWAFYFSANTYFIKSHRLLPVQSLFVTELGVALCAWMVYGYRYGRSAFKILYDSYHHRDLPRTIGVGLFLMSSILCMYYGYQYLPSSFVNVIKLFGIVVTALCCWLLFDEKLTKKEMILIGIAFVILLIFVIA